MLKDILEEPYKLSPEQTKAVISQKRYLRIVAGAGAGKTETMTRRIVYLLLYKEIAPSAIIAFTFTEKAAQSIKNRIYERISQLKGEKGCAQLGEMFIGTIHGYCHRLLEEVFGYGEYNVLDENQEMAFLFREGWNLGLGRQGSYAENCQNFLRSINVVYNELLARDKITKKNSEFAESLKKYESALCKHRLLTFGQLITIVVEKLRQNLDAVSGIKHLIVDEYQDINHAQEELIRLIGQKASVFIVGDPRQSIYQWRGSDERCFDEFSKKFKNCKNITIGQNRRSAKSIVSIANTFANSFKRRKYSDLKSTRKEDGTVILVECEDNESEAEWVSEQIKQLVSVRKVCNYSDIALLFRSVTTSAQPFINAFRKYNFPYLIGGKVGLFQRPEAQAMGRIFSWFAPNGFWVENQYNWSNRIEGEELLSSAIDIWKSNCNHSIAPQKVVKELKNLKNEGFFLRFKSFSSLYQYLLQLLGFLKFDPNDKIDAAIMANLGRFNSLLVDYESSIKLGGQEINWQYVLKGLCWYMNSYATGAYEEQPAEDLRAVDALQIMTVHQAKGLEWPVVFLPCLVSTRFPSSKIGTRQKWYIPEELFDVKRYKGDIEDERRLFYVAITRARDILFLSYFKRTKVRRSSLSPFVDVISSKINNKFSEKDNIPSVELGKRLEKEEMKTFAAGEIITYLRCPYLYKLRELWGYKPELVPELGYGKSLHHCLKYTTDLIKKGTDPEDAIRKSVIEKFHLPYVDKIKKEKMQKGAEKVLVEFVRANKEDMKRIEESEIRIEFPIQRATITGKVDVIIKEDTNQTLEVRDYKTSDEVTSFEFSSLQVKLYAVGLKAIGRPVASGSIAYLDEGIIKPVPVEDSELEKVKTVTSECLKYIMNNCFPPKVCEHCKSGKSQQCDYYEICKYAKEMKENGMLFDST